MNVFPLYYFPPLPWFAAAFQETEILLDIHQPYRKQRYFTRTVIQGANQKLPLVIPVERRSKRLALVKKRISYAEDWQLQHWRSLKFSYKNSPYFDYYQDQLYALYTTHYEFLTEYLLACLHTAFHLLQCQPSILTTTTYKVNGAYAHDYRRDFEPPMNHPPSWYREVSYEQGIGELRAELSILDVLFSMGPESRLVLESSFKKNRSMT